MKTTETALVAPGSAPGSALASALTADDQERIGRYAAQARSANTLRAYSGAWSGWLRWAAANGHQVMPADPAAVAAYLTHRADSGKATATIRSDRAAIGAAHREIGADDPTVHEGVRRVLQGIARDPDQQRRGRGQAAPLTADGLAAIIATADRPRRRGRGWETEQVATDRGATDKALAGLLFQGGLRRSEAAALTWGDVQRATDGAGVLVTIRRSKTDQTGDRADVRYIKGAAAGAVLALRGSGPVSDDDAPVLGGLTAESVGRRLTEAGRAAGIPGRLTGHSGRVGLATELTALGASTTDTMRAGGWASPSMVAHYAAGATAERGAVSRLL